MLLAKDIMNKNVITVKENTPIFEAMDVLVRENVTGLPVITDDAHVIGIVSEKDMLSLLYDVKGKNQLVSEIMVREIVSFEEDAQLFDLCECLIKSHFRRVPILSQGKLVGIISRRDLIRFILKLRKKKG